MKKQAGDTVHTMLVFVDYEHADGYESEYGTRIQAARTWITYRLEDVSGRHCMLVRYNRVDADLLDRLGAEAVFISGSSLDPDHFDPAEVDPLRSIISSGRWPLFGFCGGFQLISQTLGADLIPLNDEDAARSVGSEMVTLDSGRPFEFGYHPVDVDPAADHDPLVTGLGQRPVFRHAHGLHVPEPPDGFRVLASTPVTPIQLMAHDERRIVGTQFHPEYWTDEHPAGQALIANFLNWAGVSC